MPWALESEGEGFRAWSDGGDDCNGTNGRGSPLMCQRAEADRKWRERERKIANAFGLGCACGEGVVFVMHCTG